MRKPLVLLAAAGGLLASTICASAELVLTFGQESGGDPISATVNGSDTQTTITGTDIAVSVTQILGGAPVTGFFDLDATSQGAASSLGGGLIEQTFGGTFSITSLAGDSGTNFLSGTFTDATFGTGTGLTLTASDGTVGEAVSFSSDVIPTVDLLPPQSINLAFADVAPPVGITGTTLGAFTSSVSGDFSATPAPEPMSLAIVGSGIAALGFIRRRRAR